MIPKLILQRLQTLIHNRHYNFCNLNKKPNLYKLFQVSPKAKPSQIKYSYYRLTMKLSNNPDKQTQKKLMLLNEAYNILYNDKLREKYDIQSGFNQNAEEQKMFKNKFDKYTEAYEEKSMNHQAKKTKEYVKKKQTKEQKMELIYIIVTFLLVMGLLTIFFRYLSSTQVKTAIKQYKSKYATFEDVYRKDKGTSPSPQRGQDATKSYIDAIKELQK